MLVGVVGGTSHPPCLPRPFWLSCRLGRNVGAVQANGYKIGPRAKSKGGTEPWRY